MILNATYYQLLWEKFKNVQILSTERLDNSVHLSIKIILEQYRKKTPLQVNFQNSKESILQIARHLFVELANDIYLNHYDLPNDFCIGDKLKKIKDNQYYEIIRTEKDDYTLRQVLRKGKRDVSPAIIHGLTYDKLTKGYVKVDLGISERTIKNYFSFFQELNNESSEFPKTNFEMKSVFISKRSLWDDLDLKNKVPSIYLPNPREESNLSEQKSIPALSDCMIYFTSKYEVCYQKILLKNKKIKTIVIIDTEASAIQQMLQDRIKFGFNIIILSNSLSPIKNDAIPCWDWFKEELEIVNAL
ncbi:hypothetical protein [[Flexibacter] sp. ATCC 35208]|uniref:hypothetical protein n=1 Tax=[Flexibacter] sp. ATCC 35208 TaxID=1936242 RepID=UPI0009D00916|nr:hypothetical protein [[Flexibacter] sp. ATCC 35208]OMP77072.1 hypothetical protein BW716_21765 [[Flexibacter] sp. ATCC 35208]